MAEHFRHCFLQALLAAKLIRQRKVTDLLSRKHSGFHIDNGGEAPVALQDTEGRRRLAEYLLRAPFSLQKITWNPDNKTVICRSRRSWQTKRNFTVFKATDFFAATIERIPPKGQQVIRYYGVYSNKTRGLWQSLISLPPPPEPPFYIDTFEPINPPRQAIRGGIPAAADEAPATDTHELWDQSTDASTDQAWKAPEIDLGDGLILVLDSA